MQPTGSHIGEYIHYTHCRFCFSKDLFSFIDFGYFPLAGGFLKSKALVKNEKLYPLEILFCQHCFLVQSNNTINQDTLFKTYFYHSSAIKTLTNHFKTFADETILSLQNSTSPFVVEIGCNDGALISHFLEKDIKVMGVDPATNIVTPLIKQGLPLLNDYFSEKVAKKIKKEYGGADIICGFNVLAHIEDMHVIVKGVRLLLKHDGVLIFETHYLGNLLQEMQYDMIYHEHQYYYSLMTLQKLFSQYEMEIYDVRAIPIHAGSMRYYVQKKKGGKQTISQNVKKLFARENALRLDTSVSYASFAKQVLETKKNLLSLLDSLKKEKKVIAGYGASGRGTIIMNYCGLDERYLDYVIDDAPAKQGAYTPGTHLKIVSSDILKSKSRPDYVLLFAWSFVDEIKKKQEWYLKNGGKFILPLPEVRIIS